MVTQCTASESGVDTQETQPKKEEGYRIWHEDADNRS